LARAQNAGSVVGKSNVFDGAKQQQVRALGRLGWTLSRIQEATGVRRETLSDYLKAAGIAVRSRGRPSESKGKTGNFPAAGVVVDLAFHDGPSDHRSADGQVPRTRLFVLTLGYLRKAVRLLV
jgi:hypothetical protein